MTTSLVKKIKNVAKPSRHLDAGVSGLKRINDSFSSVKILKDSSLLKEILDDVHLVDKDGALNPMIKSINKPLQDVIRYIRMGDLDELIEAYRHVPDEVPAKRILNKHFADATVKDTFRKIMETNYPDRKLFSTTERSRKSTKNKLGAIFDEKIDFDQKYGGLDKLYRSNKKFRRLIDNLERLPSAYNKTTLVLKRLFVTVVLGFGVSGLLACLMQQAKETAGCWRVYMTRSGEISTCKIIQCSCADPQYRPKSVCAKLPNITNIGSTCVGWPAQDRDLEGAQCRKCDVYAPRESPQHLAPEEMVDPRDVYVCRSKPNLGELLGEFIFDLPGQVWDGINTTADVLIALFKYGGIFLLGGILVTVLLKLSDWYAAVKGFFRSRHRRDSDRRVLTEDHNAPRS